MAVIVNHRVSGSQAQLLHSFLPIFPTLPLICQTFQKWVETIKEVLEVVSLCPKLTQTPRNTGETRPTGNARKPIKSPAKHSPQGSGGEPEGETEIEFPRRGDVLL